MLFRSFIFCFSCICLLACNPYKSYKSKYSFKSETGKPDYASLDYWAAHPHKWDPSDSMPLPLSTTIRDTSVDVFFLHPTSLTNKTNRREDNAIIDDWFINAKTDYTSILYQASVFNNSGRVFAPRYRQAHIRNFFSKDSLKAQGNFQIAYADVKAAFTYYLTHYNHGRPIIIASHSQGSFLAEQLLRDFFEDKPLQQQLVVAYIAGWPLPKDYFKSLKMCEDSLQTGCICSWRTVRKGFVPSYVKKYPVDSYVTNPLTWNITDEYAGSELNIGSVLYKFNKVYMNTTDAQAGNGLLQVRKPKFPWGFLYFTRNYHAGDINLFYLNIRQNVQQRIRAYQKNAAVAAH